MSNTIITMTDGTHRTAGAGIVHGQLSMPELSEGQIDQWCDLMVDYCESGQVVSGGRKSHDAGYFNASIPSHLQAVLQERLGASFVIPERSCLLCCRGATFHTDAEAFPDDIFLVLWMTDEDRWDFFAPESQTSIPLKRGTFILFDPSLPHGVAQRGTTQFDPAFFENEERAFYICFDFGAKTMSAKAKQAIGLDCD